MFVSMIVCIHLPRFELLVAAKGGGGVEQALAGRAMAVAPPAVARSTAGAGGPRSGCVGEVSGAAEARGVFAGMALGEALARCADLVLVPADPVTVAESWERILEALESTGVAVETPRAGLAYFDAEGLRRLNGTDAATIAAARHACMHAAGPADAGRRPRIGGAPSRFCALAAAMAVRSRRPLLLEGAQARLWLAGRPVGLLGHREQTAPLVEPLGRLGVRTLGELARLGRAALADRFGERGALAHRLACGEDGPLRPRRVEDLLEETMEVGDASSGTALERVLGVLVDRLLARRERRGRTMRALVLSARLATGGGWRERVVLRQAISDPERIRLALGLRLQALPAPACALSVSVERFGPAASEQGALLDGAREVRAARLREAVAQIRAAGGVEAALRAVFVDPDSRVPERRVALAPLPE